MVENFSDINLIYIAIPFFVISIIIEVIYTNRKNLKYYEIKDTISSLSMGIGNVMVITLFKGITLYFYTLLYQYRLFDLGIGWQVWLLLLFSDDFSYYWFHRFSHRNRYFWASHVIHHSSTRYNLSTALRQTWTGLITGTLIFWFWLPLVGFHPIMIVTMKSISLIYQFWIHTETIKKMPKIFELIFNTPSHHRVHHGTDSIYVDKNYAGIFIIWDKLFKTFQAEIQTPNYGILHNIKSYNPFYIATHEWIDMFRDLKWKNGIVKNFNYIFKPPEWKHKN